MIERCVKHVKTQIVERKLHRHHRKASFHFPLHFYFPLSSFFHNRTVMMRCRVLFLQNIKLYLHAQRRKALLLPGRQQDWTVCLKSHYSKNSVHSVHTYKIPLYIEQPITYERLIPAHFTLPSTLALLTVYVEPFV